MIRVLSLGAGVQSTTMALMAAKGELPMPDCAIFADTQWEPKHVYAHLDWLEGKLPFPVHRVTGGSLKDDTVRRGRADGGRVAAIPWHGLMPNGTRSMGRRQCTNEYKLRPLQRKVVELLGGRPKAGCEMWIGISTDEAGRMKPSRVGYIVNRWPLIDLGMSRNSCIAWMEKNGYPRPPKSSCLGCPFHSDNEWRIIKSGPVDEWEETVAIDKAIRNQPKMKMQQFMHRSCKPLDEVDFSTLEDHGQVNMFNNECEGMCGV